MSEPDHLWLRPMPNLMADRTPAAFPFFYIEPAKKDFKHITEKFTGPLTLRQAESIVPMGESLCLIAISHFLPDAALSLLCWWQSANAPSLEQPENSAWQNGRHRAEVVEGQLRLITRWTIYSMPLQATRPR